MSLRGSSKALVVFCAAILFGCCSAHELQCSEVESCSEQEDLMRDSQISLIQTKLFPLEFGDPEDEAEDVAEESSEAAQEVSPTARAAAVVAGIAEKAAGKVSVEIDHALTPKAAKSESGTGDVPTWQNTAATNHSELAYLAGVPTLNNNRDMSDIGWKLVSPEIKAPPVIADDVMMIWKKNRICAITFSATADLEDLTQHAKIKKTPFCGFKDMREGHVDEQRDFYKSDSWERSMKLLTPIHCDHIYAVGHSMGGSTAGMFAYCANRPPFNNKDKKYYKHITQEVKLVTFGSAQPSYTPVYNKEKGQCFKGARYYLSGVAPTPWTSEQFQDLGKHFWSTLRMISYNPKASALMPLIKKENARLGAAIKQNDKMQQTRIRVVLNGFLTKAMRLIEGTKNPMAKNSLKTYALSHQPMFQYEYDPVPSMRTFNGFSHPLQSAYALPHPLSSHKWASTPRPPHTDEPGAACTTLVNSKRPLHNDLRSEMGKIGQVAENGPSFPNHFICCYARALGDRHTKCGKTYKIGGYVTGCIEPRWR